MDHRSINQVPTSKARRTFSWVTQSRIPPDVHEGDSAIWIHLNTLRGYADLNLIEHIRLRCGRRRFTRASAEEFIARPHDHTIAEPTDAQIEALLRERGE